MLLVNASYIGINKLIGKLFKVRTRTTYYQKNSLHLNIAKASFTGDK